MSSGGWEVVSKNRKNKNSGGKSAKLTKAEKKKFIENAPKVEDFLPLSQVKTLYDNLDGDKENKKPPKEKESKTKENEDKKKQAKQLQEKKKQEPKEKTYKSLKDALNAIDAKEFDNILVTGQTLFPDGPLIWLKNLLAFLNAKITVEHDDPVFSGKPADYPTCLLPKTIRSTLERAIESAGAQTAQLFYENTLTAMVSDMTKGTPVVGHKLFLQLLASSKPEMTVANIAKLISLRNSYQNRKSIGLSLLWALAQGGRKNTAVGLKCWHEVMAPLIETRNYAAYVAQILHDLVFGTEKSNVDEELYVTILDDVYSGKANASSPVSKEITKSVEKLRIMVFKNENLNHRKLCETALNIMSPDANSAYNEELTRVLLACLLADPRCFATWRSSYAKHLYQSHLLLRHIDSQWDEIQSRLNKKQLQETLMSFLPIHEKSRKGKDKSIAVSCAKYSEKILEKMTSKSKKGGGFPWKRGCFVLMLLIGAVVAFDCYKHGSFEASSTNRILNNSGATGYGLKSWQLAKVYCNKGLEYVESTSPEYYKATVDFCSPYVRLAKDIGQVLKNISVKLYYDVASYVAEKRPIVAATIEYYAPGLIEEVHLRSIRGVELVKEYSYFFRERIVEHSSKAIRWLQINVFVGNLSPESLQKYASRAIDTTQTFASQTYDWVYEKVQMLSKVQ